MKTLKTFIIAMITGATLYSCQQDDNMVNDSEDILTVSAIAEEDLPEAAQSYLASNFQEEFVTAAYEINEGNGDVAYEAFMTNSMNVVFSQAGVVTGFGDDASLVSCDGMMRERLQKRHERRKHHGDSTHEAHHVRIEITALPEAAQAYLSDNFVDSLVICAIKAENEEDEIFYHVLVARTGIVRFDADGNFIELKVPKIVCPTFEEIAPADLPEEILTYISTNYPNAVIKKATKGTIDDISRIHVVLERVGVLVFTEEGELLRFKPFRKRNG
ncbi:MAG: hypothetical protein ACI83W_002717 [Marinoscillum sp.]|jgi:hypothetical protein